MVAVDRHHEDARPLARAPCFDEEVGSWPGAQGRPRAGACEAREEYGFRVQGGDHVVLEAVPHGPFGDGESEGSPQFPCLHGSVGELRALAVVGEGQVAAGPGGHCLAILQSLPVFGHPSASSVTGKGGGSREDAQQVPGGGNEILPVDAL